MIFGNKMIMVIIFSIICHERLDCAAPASHQKKLPKSTQLAAQLVRGISSDLKGIHALLGELVNKSDLHCSLSSYEPSELAELRRRTSDFLINMGVIAQNMGIKETAESSVSQGAVAQGGASRKVALDCQSMGTATGNLMASSPKHNYIFKMGNNAKKLLAGYAEKSLSDMKDKISSTDMLALRKFQNISDQRLEKFVNFMDALRKGVDAQGVYAELDADSISNWIYAAAIQMDEQGVEELHQVFEKLVQ